MKPAASRPPHWMLLYMAPMRRRSFLLIVFGALLVVVVLAVTRDEEHGRDWLSWLPGQARHSFAHAPCNIPVHFLLAEVDPRFGFDRLTVMSALVEAANLWQAQAERVLFLESDHPRAMRVSLRFDDRQAAANTRRELRGGLERDRAQLNAEEAVLAHWGERIAAARNEHERAMERLALRAAAHEREVAAWNGGQGARTDARRRELEAEATGLQTAFADLERAGQDLNSEISAHNRRASDLRRQSEKFQAGVVRYNEASSAEPVETGRYTYERATGRRIDVFRAESFDELVWVLAHELGHALGLDHVEHPDAVMHALLHDGDGMQPGRVRPVELAAADRRALAESCGTAIEEDGPAT
jgi:hypothetical protein